MTDAAGRVTVSTGVPERPADIPALTGVRAIAAVIVVAHHMRPLVDMMAPGPIAAALRPVLMSGVPSLDVFFLLSGFVIAHNYAHRLDRSTPGAWRSYLQARVARIYPLHLVTFLVICVIVGLSALQDRVVDAKLEHTPLGFVANLAMLQGLPGVTAWNFPSWSLTVEFAAYLVFPLIAGLVLRLRWRTAVAVAGLALCLQLTIMFQLGSDDLGSAVMGWPRIAGEFIAGAMAWVVWRHVLRPGLWADVVVVLCTVAAWWLLLSGYAWVWTVPLFAVMIPAVACASGPVGGFLAHPITRWGGRISLAVYLVHIPVVSTAVMWVVPAGVYSQHSTLGAALALGGIFVAAFASGALLHHGVEEPARRWLLGRLAQRSARRRDEPDPARIVAEEVQSTART